jgi:hypothetical protein
MPTKVTFECQCPASVATLTVQRLDKPSESDGLVFKKSGTKSLDLASAEWALVCRVVGEPGTDFSLTVTKGATMNPVERTLGRDGRAAANRDLKVE